MQIPSDRNNSSKRSKKPMKQEGTVPTAVQRGQSWQELYDEVQKLRLAVWSDLAVWGKETGGLEAWQQTLCENFRAKLERGKKPKMVELETMLDLLEAACTRGFMP